jgi:hypothetical protein
MLIDLQRNPGTTQLRQFALSTLVMFPFLAWLWSGRAVPIACAVAAGLILVACSWLRPGLLKPLFVGLSLLTWPIGWIVIEVVLVILYYAVLTPAGMISRMLGRDPLALKPESTQKSAWTDKQSESGPERYFRMS